MSASAGAHDVGIVFLDDPLAHDPALAGGKAAALARLRSAGLPVPRGFVITSGVFGAAIAALGSQIADILGDADLSNPRSLDEASAAAQALIFAGGMPPWVDERLREALRRLGARTFAVRSSATVEDLPSASFAGQYDSFLNVSPSLGDGVLRVWASLYSSRAVAYRRRQGLAPAGGSMAVLVMEMVQPMAAGVLFTRDTADGSSERMLVSGALGLGEGVVTGRIVVDGYWLDVPTGTVVRREVPDKPTMIVADPAGGTREMEVDAARRTAPALDDAQLGRLWTIARQVQEVLGGEQDIEFAAAPDGISVMQARPLTALPDVFPVDWPAPEDAAHTWHLMRARPLRRLHEDISRAFYAAKRRVYEEVGVPHIKESVLMIVEGYPYARVPDVDEQEIARRYEAHQATIRRQWEDSQTTPFEAEIADTVRAHYRTLRAIRPRVASLDRLVPYLERAVEVYAQVMWDLHWRDDVLAWDWSAIYQEMTGRPQEEALRLVQGIPTQTTRMLQALRHLTRLVQSSSALSAIVETKDYDRLDDLPFDDPVLKRFGRRFRRFLQRYGRRSGSGFGSRGDIVDHTWGMRPGMVLDLIAAVAAAGVDAVQEREAAARRERYRVTRRVRQALATDPERRARFEEALRTAQRDVLMMEDHNHLIDQEAFGLMREAIWEVGTHLVTLTAIDDPDDVFHLSLEELRSLAEDGPHELRPLVQARRAEYDRRSRLKPPRTLGAPPPPQAQAQAQGASQEPAGLQGDRLIGQPASPGQTTGPARVLRDVRRVAELRPGEVLVTANAGPDLTPWFPILSALVLDAGVVQQHSGIIAREYGIPAVFGTREATSVISTGQTITVDGTAGVVLLRGTADPGG
ncbi:MAG: PEP/pyruvate-binding domain-containing protein [Anaerolineales bacterium]